MIQDANRPMDHPEIQRRFSAALETLTAAIKTDRSILAAILCGSLSHDAVWDKSDIDLVLVTIDDKKVPASDVALYADGLNVHTFLVPRAEFRKLAEGSRQHSFMHSLLAKGRLLYTHDETISDLCSRLQSLGAADTALQLLGAATRALPSLYKARKWFITRGDLEYTALWILYTATPLAQIEVLSRGLLLDREVIPQAARLNPPLFDTIYVGLLNAAKTEDTVRRALEVGETYLAERAGTLFAPILDYLRDVGDVRSCKDLDDYFTRHLNVTGVPLACEYLADQGLVGKASAAVRLTRKSTVDVQELAFFHLSNDAPTPPRSGNLADREDA